MRSKKCAVRSFTTNGLALLHAFLNEYAYDNMITNIYDYDHVIMPSRDL
jgi:hypothetical protein